MCASQPTLEHEVWKLAPLTIWVLKQKQQKQVG